MGSDKGGGDGNNPRGRRWRWRGHKVAGLQAKEVVIEVGAEVSKGCGRELRQLKAHGEAEAQAGVKVKAEREASKQI